MVDQQDFMEMFEKNPLAHAVVDADLKFLMMNDAFCKLVGFNKDRLMTIKFSDFRTQGMIRYLRDSGESVTDAVNGRRITSGQSTFESPSGLHVVVRTNIPLLGKEGDLKFVYVTYNEITKIVKSQEYIAKEVAELSKAYAKMAEGDLTVRYAITEPDQDTREMFDQITKLRDAVRGIVINLENNIGDVNKKMLNLTRTAENATRSIEDGSKGVQQIAQNAGKVSSNAEKASQGVEQIAKAMQDMSAAIEEITSSMESVSNLSKQTNDLSRAGASLATRAEKSMKEISASSTKVYGIVSDVEKQMGEISKIVLLIRELANQTNLLALNAAIEAARAGDAGRGFAVVATEVKSLAQESRNSAERIEEMITNLKKSTANASAAMNAAQGVVEQGSHMVTETLESFNKIAAAVEKVAGSATEVAAATEEQAATTEEITASISEVATLVEQTAKEAGDAAAATEESSAALDEITRMVESVHKIAVEAMEANKKFRVD
ncbi:MAG TPA: methyl-accepting chemotaxis protein [Methanoregula sp.]|nr:methyl-accepting chemotaxis protein [Methanoregula sp.]